LVPKNLSSVSLDGIRLKAQTSREAQSRAAVPLAQKEIFEVVWASDLKASREPCDQHFPVMTFLEEALMQAQNLLEGLDIPSDLGSPQDPQGGTGGCHWGEGCLE